MAPFPETLAPASPLDTDLVSLGAGQIRALKQLLADIFGIPVSPSTVSAAAFGISSTGVVTVAQGNPTTTTGVATKGYVDNQWLKLYKSNNQAVTATAAADTVLVVPVTANQRWHARFYLATDKTVPSAGLFNLAVSGPAGATYNLSNASAAWSGGATPTLALGFATSNFFEVNLVIFVGATAGNVTLTYGGGPGFNVVSGSALLATQVTPV